MLIACCQQALDETSATEAVIHPAVILTDLSELLVDEGLTLLLIHGTPVEHGYHLTTTE
jgi:hypothetical protein